VAYTLQVINHNCQAFSERFFTLLRPDLDPNREGTARSDQFFLFRPARGKIKIPGSPPAPLRFGCGARIRIDGTTTRRWRKTEFFAAADGVKKNNPATAEPLR